MLVGKMLKVEDDMCNDEDKHHINSQRDEEVTSNGSLGDPSPAKPPVTAHQMLIFLTVSLCYVAVTLSSSILAPFFPNEAHQKDISPIHIGLIFAAYNFSNCLTAPLFGMFLPVLGAKFTCLAGTWVSGGCNLLFGFLPAIADQKTFLVYCYIIRVVEGAGCAASVTAGMTIVANTFPNRVAQMNGLYESAAGIGLMAGPALGGLLYGLGGYKMPFLVLGSVNLFFVVASFVLLPSVAIDEDTPGSLWKIMRIPAVYPVLLTIFVASCSISFLDPTLSIHLQTFNLTPALIGLEFFVMFGFYGIASPIWGHFVDKWKTSRIMIVVALYLATISYLLIGPSPILKLPRSIWIINAGLVLAGLSLSLAMIAGFIDLFLSAEWYKITCDLALQGVISGIFNCAYWIGSVVGPSLAGFLLDEVGFPWASSIIALLNLVSMAIVSLFCIWEYQCGKGKRQPNLISKTLVDQEQQPLLDDSTSLIQEDC